MVNARTARRSALAAALAAPLALGACAGSLSPAEKAAQCTTFASAVVPAGLKGTPTAEQAKTVAEELDSVISDLRDPAVHDAAVQLHTDLHAMDTAYRKGDTAKVQSLLADARRDAAKAAAACGIPASAFTG